MIKLDISSALFIAFVSIGSGFAYDSAAIALFAIASLLPCFWKIE